MNRVLCVPFVAPFTVSLAIVGVGGAIDESSERYAMPPWASESELDVRFGWNRNGERFTRETKELPLLIESNGSAVKLSVSMQERAGSRYTSVVGKREKLIQEYRLEEGKPVPLTPEEGMT